MNGGSAWDEPAAMIFDRHNSVARFRIAELLEFASQWSQLTLIQAVFG
jgi:hypothetical protein